MYPAYRWTDSYPHHTYPIHYAPVNDQRHREITSPMKMDPSTQNLPYQHCPYGGNHYYTAPHGYHSCCNHGCFGGCPYSFQHPYPHYPPPPPPPPPYGFCPPFPGTYPGYSSPPPHFSIEQPRYDYDKNTQAHSHCGGCDHREDDKKLRIEPEEPEVEKKTSNSLVPLLLKDYPYPIMWVPPGYMDTEPKAKERDKHSHDTVSSKPLEYLKKGGYRETTQDQQGEDCNRFPFPIFWLPYKSDEVAKDSKENDHNLVAHKELPSVGSDDNKKPTTKTKEVLESEDQSEMSKKSAVQKVIPVKQLGTDEEKKSPTKTKAESSMDKTDNGIEGKHSPRSSKLPPVCLRIDPLPKKKKSSRSPSPPADKGRSKGSPADDAKSSHQQTQSSEGLKKNKEEQPKCNVKTIEVINDANKVENDGVADHHENVLRNQEIKNQGEGKKSEKEMMQDPAHDSKYPQQQTQLSEGLKKSKEETKGDMNEVINDANNVENDNLADLRENVPRNLEIKNQHEGNERERETIQSGESCKAEKKSLSENEAALIIQSVYRGFEVRKSQPLMKLRQIAGVGKQVVELRNRIQDLESSTIPIDDKQKLIIGETIMSLLLKLDTIQGLHPVVRDVRKSVAKELVGLQEKLDSLTSAKPETLSEVVHSEDDTADHEKSDQVQVKGDRNVNHLDSGLGLRENREVEPTSQSSEELNQLHASTEQPADDVIQVKLEQTQAQSDSQDQNISFDTVTIENHEVEAADSGHEAQVIEPRMEELNNNQLHVSDEIHEKSDQAQVESGTNVETMESDVCEHHGVEPAGSEDDGGAKVCDTTDINLEPRVDLKSQQSSVELTNNQLEMPQTAQPLDDSEHMLSSGYPEVEAKQSRDEGNMQSCDNDSIEVLGSVEAENDGSMVEMVAAVMENDGKNMVSNAYPEVEAKISQEEVGNGLQEVLSVSTEEAPKVDDDIQSSTEFSMEDLGGAPPLPTTGSLVSGGGDGKMTEEEENDSKAEIESMDSDKVKPEESHVEVGKVSAGGDEGKKLAEENEKLRVAVEELMKAGNEQVRVIKELTGRVKDLEKKLSVSKKKKKIKVSKCRSPGSVIVA